jgi:hypothetical protein
MKLQHILIKALLVSSLVITIGITPAQAITNGGKCNGSTGNSLVMKNGKVHGGQAGNNKNYVGPLFLCDGGRWLFWENAKPQPKPSTKKDDPSVKPGFSCSQLGKVVATQTYGKLQCKYFRAGRLQTLRWSY